MRRGYPSGKNLGYLPWRPASTLTDAIIDLTRGDGEVRLWPDLLPHEPSALRAWLKENAPTKEELGQ